MSYNERQTEREREREREATRSSMLTEIHLSTDHRYAYDHAVRVQLRVTLAVGPSHPLFSPFSVSTCALCGRLLAVVPPAVFIMGLPKITCYGIPINKNNQLLPSITIVAVGS